MNTHGLSGFIARYNDYLIRTQLEKEGVYPLTRLADLCVGPTVRQYGQHMLSRLISVTVFPIFLAFDLIFNLIRAPIEWGCAQLSFNKKSQQSHLIKARQCLEDVEKCALGILFSPAGLISPDIMTRHFVPKVAIPGVIEAGGKYHFAKGTEQLSKTIVEVQQWVQQAIEKKKKVTISGAHLSQSKDTLPTDSSNICLNLSELNKVEIDPTKKTAKVQAGATWKDVQAAANSYGLGVKVQQGSNIFSIGGSLGVNCHGWDHRTGTLSETVRSLTIINAQGELQVLTPKDELFGTVIGGHGLFGIIVEAEIDLIPNESLISWGEKIAPRDYVSHFREKILPNPDHRMHVYRLSVNPNNLLKEGVSVSYSITKENPKTGRKYMPGQGVSLKLVDEPEKGSRIERILIHLARSFGFFRTLYWKMDKKKKIQDERLSRNEFMRPRIQAAFNHSRADAGWLQEYFVKGEDLAPFLDKLSKTLTDNNVTLLNATIRFVKKDDATALPYAKGEDRYAIVLFFNQSLANEEIEKTKKWTQQVIAELIKCGGSYYLPYQQFATAEQFNSCYPRDTIIALKNKHDPKRLFDNGLYEQYVKPWDQSYNLNDIIRK